MFEEIVRQYALEQVKSSFIFSNIGIFAFSNTRKENLPEYNKKLLKHLEDKEYSKIDCDFNSFCFIHTTKAALLYLKGQYSDVLSFCKKEEKNQELSEFFISIVEYETYMNGFRQRE